MSQKSEVIMVKNITWADLYNNGPKKATRKPISKDLREKVWLKYMGNKVEGKCYCCRIKSIHFTDFEVGHNKAVSRGGKNNIENLRPICRSCNHGMKSKTIEWYRNKYYVKPSEKPKKITKTKKPKKQSLFGGFDVGKETKINPFKF